jgi:hypothetical protein
MSMSCWNRRVNQKVQERPVFPFGRGILDALNPKSPKPFQPHVKGRQLRERDLDPNLSF